MHMARFPELFDDPEVDFGAADATAFGDAGTPCAQTGLCAKCRDGNRLCRATLILDCRPLASDVTVIVVAEEIGF